MGTVPSDSVLLHGLAFSGYRSFTEPGVPLAPLGKVNLLAGQNNAGKSNVLRFLRDLFKETLPAPSVEIDRPQSVLPQHWNVRLRVVLPGFELPEDMTSQPDDPAVQTVLAALRSAPGMAETAGVAFSFVLVRDERYGAAGADYRRWALETAHIPRIAEYLARQNIRPMQAVNIFTSKNYVSGGSPLQFTTELVEAPKLADLPPVRIIQAFCSNWRVRVKSEPSAMPFRRSTTASTRFVRHILDDSSATLHIPYDASTVQIQRGSSVLPLDSLGTGVHQVVMLAAAGTLLTETLIGLEEPEVHLHPLLQRRLVKYLAEETDNQYLIATHSAHLLDYELGRVFHLTYTEAGTDVAPAGTPHEVAKVCADLGYRPSDLLQSNAVIWVEGPSDGLYLRCWLLRVAPKLIEGIHYSSMFHGGGLLRHLT